MNTPEVRMKQSWKHSLTIPRVVMAAVRKGLRLADSIGVEEDNDKRRLVITFKKFPVNPAEPVKRLPCMWQRRCIHIANIIRAVDERAMAADGPVTPTLQEMTQQEMSEIFALASGEKHSNTRGRDCEKVSPR